MGFNHKISSNVVNKVSVVCTVKNEGKTIGNLLQSLQHQIYPPDEIIIVDGGSEDDTVDVINKYKALGLPIKLIVSEGCNRAQGRNIGIENSSNELIALVDAGCVPSPNWIKELLANLDEDVDVVSGTYFKQVCSFQDRIIYLAYLPNFEKLKSEAFLPSARSMLLRKSLWKRVGGFPEWLDTAEDTYFDLKARQLGAKFKVAKKASVSWNVCDSLRHLFSKIYNYGVGEGIAGLLFRKLTLIELIFACSLMASFTAVLLHNNWSFTILLIIVCIIALFLFALYRYFIYHEVRKWKFKEFFAVFFVLMCIRFCHLLGVLVGFFKRGVKSLKFRSSIMVRTVLMSIFGFFVYLIIETGLAWLNTAPRKIPDTTFLKIHQLLQHISLPLNLFLVYSVLWFPPLFMLLRRYRGVFYFSSMKKSGSFPGLMLLFLSLLTCFLTRIFPYFVYDRPIGYDVPAYLIMMKELMVGIPLQKFCSDIGHYLSYTITLGPFLPFTWLGLDLMSVGIIIQIFLGLMLVLSCFIFMFTLTRDWTLAGYSAFFTSVSTSLLAMTSYLWRNALAISFLLLFFVFFVDYARTHRNKFLTLSLILFVLLLVQYPLFAAIGTTIITFSLVVERLLKARGYSLKYIKNSIVANSRLMIKVIIIILSATLALDIVRWISVGSINTSIFYYFPFTLRKLALTSPITGFDPQNWAKIFSVIWTSVHTENPIILLFTAIGILWLMYKLEQYYSILIIWVLVISALLFFAAREELAYRLLVNMPTYLLAALGLHFIIWKEQKMLSKHIHVLFIAILFIFLIGFALTRTTISGPNVFQPSTPDESQVLALEFVKQRANGSSIVIVKEGIHNSFLWWTKLLTEGEVYIGNLYSFIKNATDEDITRAYIISGSGWGSLYTLNSLEMLVVEQIFPNTFVIKNVTHSSLKNWLTLYELLHSDKINIHDWENAEILLDNFTYKQWEVVNCELTLQETIIKLKTPKSYCYISLLQERVLANGTNILVLRCHGHGNYVFLDLYDKSNERIFRDRFKSGQWENYVIVLNLTNINVSRISLGFENNVNDFIELEFLISFEIS